MIATKCITSVCSEMAHSFSEDDYFYSVVSVYVKRGTDDMEKDREKLFFESMGGKATSCVAAACVPSSPQTRPWEPSARAT